MKIYRKIMSCFVLMAILMLYHFSYSQTVDEDVDSDSVEVSSVISFGQRPAEYEEQVLETIRIEAVVEKPSVTLIPKKAETKIATREFGQRSFDKELKAKPDILSEFGKEFESGKRIKKLKKLLAKEIK